MIPGPDRTALTPTVLVVLDDTVRPLAPRATLAIARRSAAASRLVTGIDLVGRTDAFPSLLRAAVERVTDVRARTAAIRAGHALRDEILVVLAFALGGERPTAQDLRKVLESLLAAAADFYRGSRLEVHAAVLLPDLGGEREARYHRAYALLASLDEADAPAAPLLDGRPLLARRWLCDCRTAVGAFPGRADAVLDPLAEFVATAVVGETARAVDAELEPALHGAHHARPTRCSAPGYAELAFSPRVLARYVACRVGADLLAREGRDPAAGARGGVERAVDGFYRVLRPGSVADGLLAALDDGPDVTDERRARHAHARQAARAAGRAEAAAAALVHARAALEEWGAPAAALFARGLAGPTADEGAGAIHPDTTVARMEEEARGRVRASLGADTLAAEAQALDAEAGTLEAMQEPGGEPDPRLAQLRTRAGALRGEAARLDALARSSRFDEMEAELLRALATSLAASGASEFARAAAAEEERPPVSESPESPPPVRGRGLGGWLRRVLGRGGAEPSPPPAADRRPASPPPAAPVASPAGDGDGALLPADAGRLVEWLRWLAEFRGDLDALRGEVERFARDAEDGAAFYEAEAAWLLDELARDRPFSHRIVSANQCRAIHAERREALEVALRETSALPLSRRLDPAHGPPEALQRAVNLRFDGLDEALDAVVEAGMADWLARDVEDVLFDDAWSGARFDPAARLRAVWDAARPLLRPDPACTAPATADVVLLPLPPERSRVAAAWGALDGGATFVDGLDGTRVGIRAAAHGFPLHGLPQLRPVRDRHPEPARDGAGRDPLPHEALVRAEMAEVIALAHAFGEIRADGGMLHLPPLAPFRDEAALCHAAATTFEGSRVFTRLRGEMAARLRTDAGVRRVREHAAAGGIADEHAAALRRVLGEIDGGAWPASLPYPEDDA